MKNISAFRFPLLALSAALAWTVPLHAADPIETHWSDICKVAAKNQLSLTTAGGDTVEGVCIHINADEIAVNTFDHRTIHIARAALSSLQLRRTQGHQLKSLGKGLRGSLGTELRWMLSPLAPLGLAAIPSTLAWDAAAAPFCALGDLVNKITPARNIKLLADSPTGNNP